MQTPKLPIDPTSSTHNYIHKYKYMYIVQTRSVTYIEIIQQTKDAFNSSNNNTQFVISDTNYQQVTKTQCELYCNFQYCGDMYVRNDECSVLTHILRRSLLFQETHVVHTLLFDRGSPCTQACTLDGPSHYSNNDCCFDPSLRDTGICKCHKIELR